MMNLWGNLSDSMSEVKTPKDIIMEQASIFNAMDNNLAYIDINRRQLTNRGKNQFQSYKDEGEDVDADFVFAFELRSEYLKDFSYDVFRIYYGIKFYPLCISFGSGIENELKKYIEDNIDIIDWDGHIYRIDDETAFVDLLERILNTNELAIIIRNVNILAKEQASADDSVKIVED